jgi:hypothetical protein
MNNSSAPEIVADNLSVSVTADTSNCVPNWRWRRPIYRASNEALGGMVSPVTAVAGKLKEMAEIMASPLSAKSCPSDVSSRRRFVSVAPSPAA